MQQSFNPKKIALALAIALAGGSLLVACGGNDDTAPTSGYVDPAMLDGQSLYATSDLANV